MSRTHTRSLSEREKAIIDLASQGLTDKEICRKLAISMTTVRTYWTRVRDKLGASNRAQIIAEVVRAGEVGVVKAAELDTVSRLSLGHWIYWPGADRVDLSQSAVEVFGLQTLGRVPLAALLDVLDPGDRRGLVGLLHRPSVAVVSGGTTHRTQNGSSLQTAVLGPCCDPLLGRGLVLATMRLDGSARMNERAMVI